MHSAVPAVAVLVALLAAAPAALTQCTIPDIVPPLTAGDCRPGAQLEAGGSCTVACAVRGGQTHAPRTQPAHASSPAR
eukprot:SAG31_NODE_32815_length_351_cov_0.825397_1_plen_77_part_10